MKAAVLVYLDNRLARQSRRIQSAIKVFNCLHDAKTKFSWIMIEKICTPPKKHCCIKSFEIPFEISRRTCHFQSSIIYNIVFEKILLNPKKTDYTKFHALCSVMRVK